MVIYISMVTIIKDNINLVYPVLVKNGDSLDIYTVVHISGDQVDCVSVVNG